jgi:LacI family transcriptional regulator
MNRKKSPTIQDVAKKAGVSPASVSRVVNENPSVKPEIRDRVKTALHELKYEAARLAGMKKGFSRKIIGLIIPDILNPFFPLLIKGIENSAKRQGYSIILCDSENDYETERMHIENLLRKGIEGLIVIPSHGRDSIAGDLINKDFPLVYLDRKIESDSIKSPRRTRKVLIRL